MTRLGECGIQINVQMIHALLEKSASWKERFFWSCKSQMESGLIVHIFCY